jgi:hypothetical protein
MIPDAALRLLGLTPEATITLSDRLAPESAPALQFTTAAREITLPVIPPLTPYFFQIESPPPGE